MERQSRIVSAVREQVILRAVIGHGLAKCIQKYSPSPMAEGAKKCESSRTISLPEPDGRGRKKKEITNLRVK